MDFLKTANEGIIGFLNPFSDNFFLKSLFGWLNPFSEDFILKNLLDWLNPFSENFILKQLWDFLTNIVSYLNPFSDNFLGKKIVDLIGDLLNKLFVPQQDHFGELSDKVNSKFGFIGQVKDLVYDLFGLNSENGISSYSSSAPSSPPNWSITYSGISVNIIDWIAFERYRGVFHSIVIFVLWGSYLIRLFKRIPGIVHGFDTNDAK